MASDTVRVAILEDHQLIIDGYHYRLGQNPAIQIVGAVRYGEQLEPLLANTPVDVVIADVSVPTSATNANPYPILHWLPRLLQQYPSVAVLVISIVSEPALIRSLLDAGASGYVFKDDAETIRELASVVQTVASGEVVYSRQLVDTLQRYVVPAGEPLLTPRQQEALSLCAAYPGEAGAVLARRMGITHSTFRNLLSTSYLRLGVSNRAEAILKARSLSLISPNPPHLSP